MITVNAETSIMASTKYTDTLTVSGAIAYSDITTGDTPEPGTPAKDKITVAKIWEDGSLTRPASISVTLYANGTAVGTATLNASNGWKHTFDVNWHSGTVNNSSRGTKIKYTVNEAATPTGYTKLISDGSHEIWNVHKDIPTEDVTPNPPKYYTLTINHSGGFSSVSVYKNGSSTALVTGPYKASVIAIEGTKFDIDAVLETGNTFKNWTGTATYTAKKTSSVTMDRTRAETAHATTTLTINHFLHDKTLNWNKVYTNTASGKDIKYNYTYGASTNATPETGIKTTRWTAATYTIAGYSSVSAATYTGFNGWRTVYLSSAASAPTVTTKTGTTATNVYIVSGGSYASMYFTREGDVNPTSPAPVNPSNPTTKDPTNPQYPTGSPISGQKEYVKITYVMNGGQYNGSASNYSQTLIAATNTTLITPTRSGYEFLGWYTNKNGSGRIGGAGEGYTVLESITVYALWYKPYDIGITANDIYGTIIKGTSFTSSATIVNHTRRNLLSSDKVNAVLTVYENGTVKQTRTFSNIETPALSTNLVSVAISAIDWDNSKTYTLTWTLDFSGAEIADKYTNNNRSSVGPITPGAMYNLATNTARPGYSTTADTRYNKNTTVPGTSVNTYSWKNWASTSSTTHAYGSAGAWSSYSTKMNITLILTPENESGLRKATRSSSVYNIPNYTTRAGYGFSVHTSDSNLTLSRKMSNVSLGIAKSGTTAYTTNVGNLTAVMTYPEFNYSRLSKSSWSTYSKYYAAETGTATYSNLRTSYQSGYWTLAMPYYSDYTSNDINDKYAHYTPMWMPQSNTEYKPVTYFGGLWSPIGEVTATVQQGQLKTKTLMDKYGVYTNSYTLKGNLYDDLYGTGN